MSWTGAPRIVECHRDQIGCFPAPIVPISFPARAPLRRRAWPSQHFRCADKPALSLSGPGARAPQTAPLPGYRRCCCSPPNRFPTAWDPSIEKPSKGARRNRTSRWISGSERRSPPLAASSSMSLAETLMPCAKSGLRSRTPSRRDTRSVEQSGTLPA